MPAASGVVCLAWRSHAGPGRHVWHAAPPHTCQQAVHLSIGFEALNTVAHSFFTTHNRRELQEQGWLTDQGLPEHKLKQCCGSTSGGRIQASIALSLTSNNTHRGCPAEVQVAGPAAQLGIQADVAVSRATHATLQATKLPLN